MNDDYEMGYQDGYKTGHADGYQKGWHEARRQKEIVSNPFDQNKDKCPKCGINLEGAMGYVCGSVNCPTGLGGRSTC